MRTALPPQYDENDTITVEVDHVLLSVGQSIVWGELSGAVPSYIESCYPAAVYKTFMQDTELELKVVPGIARCNDCGSEFNALTHDLKCPDCGSQSLTALSGMELIIKEILAC